MAKILTRWALLSLILSASGSAVVGCGGSAPSTEPQGASAVTVLPIAARVDPLSSQPFVASVTGIVDTKVQWTVSEGPSGGTVTTGGLYTAPSAPGTYHVVATSQADPALSATATVTVTSTVTVPVVVTVSPSSLTLSASATQQFTAAVTGSTNTAVAWSVREGASCGAISTGGLYSAPASSAICHVDATSQADGSTTGTATVTVTGAGGTDVPGGALTTQTWTAAGSPYRIHGDVYIPSGSRLTILPGVQVRFQGHYRLEGPGIIDARGTSPAQRDILFTAEDTTAGWYGIRIWNGTGSYTAPPDVGDYHLENCIIEYVVKDGSNPRSFANASYNDTRGALYVLGFTSYNPSCPESYCGLKQSDLHLSGLMLRHNRAMSAATSTPGGGAGMYFNSLDGGVHPVWTDVVFDDNQSYSYGAGFQQHHGGPLTFQNCTFSNGVAYHPDANDGSGYSGVLGYWDVSGPITLDGCLLTNNIPATFATTGAPDVVILNPR